jgi:hypothetical protein
MPQLPSDFEIKGLKSLQRKLLRRREFLREYDEIICEQLQNGIIEQITENNNPSLSFDLIMTQESYVLCTTVLH